MARQTKKKNKEEKKPIAKVVPMYKNDEHDIEKQTTLQQASAAEKNGDLELAEKLYKQEINKNAFNASVYTRLMIIYRKQKKYKEALERYIWFQDHALENDQAMTGVRLSFALSSWKSLADIYPPAMTALKEMRSSKTKAILDSNASSKLFPDDSYPMIPPLVAELMETIPYLIFLKLLSTIL